MQVSIHQGRRGSEYINVKNTRFRGPPGTKAKAGNKLTVSEIRRGSVMLMVGKRIERWFRVSPLKSTPKRKRVSN